jgi:hypothetical protein
MFIFGICVLLYRAEPCPIVFMNHRSEVLFNECFFQRDHEDVTKFLTHSQRYDVFRQ